MKAISPWMLGICTLACVTMRAVGMGTEDFGNEPLNAANYAEWPGILPVLNQPGRVYHSWVNGNEHFYYRGDTAALNEALAAFAASTAATHEVVLRPTAGTAKSFQGIEVAFDWLVHIQGGLSKHLGADTPVFDRFPTLTVFLGSTNIELDEILVPDGIALLDVTALRERYLRGLADTDKETRGYASMFLAELDRDQAESAKAIAALLEDPDDWVRCMAALALGRMGKAAEPCLPALRAGSENTANSEGVRTTCARAASSVEKADPPSPESIARQDALNIRIRRLLDGHRSNSPPATPAAARG
ncbi:MAG: HEAT repeat domain-containing protein [Candidatus Hydrogenedentes bacterium]|nr:HEAT repeat domain-containing protein [Candidatus Hydrogenedentota bacterium]